MVLVITQIDSSQNPDGLGGLSKHEAQTLKKTRFYLCIS